MARRSRLAPGAAAVFNPGDRIAFWEHNGYWNADCRGDAKALSAVLANFAKLDVKDKRVVVHDGIGRSYLLNMSQSPEKFKEAKIDWVFSVWQADAWQRRRELPVDLNPIDPTETEPPSQIEVYTAGIRWSDVAVPAGMKVVDERLEAHGFSAADGVVIEGRATDLATGQPIAAKMRLERLAYENEERRYPVVAEAVADADGRWVLKHVPSGRLSPNEGLAWYRVVVAAEGFVPRVAGHGRFDEQPQWRSFDTGLARPGPVSGQVTDETGNPLAGVEVQFENVQAKSGGHTNRRSISPSRPTRRAASAPKTCRWAKRRSCSTKPTIVCLATTERSRRPSRASNCEW